MHELLKNTCLMTTTITMKHVFFGDFFLTIDFLIRVKLLVAVILIFAYLFLLWFCFVIPVVTQSSLLFVPQGQFLTLNVPWLSFKWNMLFLSHSNKKEKLFSPLI